MLSAHTVSFLSRTDSSYVNISFRFLYILRVLQLFLLTYVNAYNVFLQEFNKILIFNYKITTFLKQNSMFNQIS